MASRVAGKAKKENNTYQAEQVEAAVAVLSVVEALENSLVLMELAFLDRDIDPDDVLPDDTTSADVKVTICGDSMLSASMKIKSVRTQPPSCP